METAFVLSCIVLSTEYGIILALNLCGSAEFILSHHNTKKLCVVFCSGFHVCLFFQPYYFFYYFYLFIWWLRKYIVMAVFWSKFIYLNLLLNLSPPSGSESNYVNSWLALDAIGSSS